MSTDRLILIAHGSRRPAWRAPLDALTERLRARTDSTTVRLSFMELCEPDLAQVVTEAVNDGVGRVRVLPLFMSSGGHVRNDIAPQVEALRERHPGLSIELLPSLGEHPLILDALRAIADDRPVEPAAGA